MKKPPTIFLLMIILPFLMNCTSPKKTGFTVSSTAFKSDGLIPVKYTCDGENISPPFSWSKGPKGTKTYALICDDPDAPSKVWVHWLIYNIPEAITEISENKTEIKKAKYGTNDFWNTAYGGPCPPSGTHHYHFRIYALDCELSLAPGALREAIEGAMKDHILAQGELIGKYSH
jgi:Raf kinase inhibitor-like YbhB/YbcL family protein